MSLNENNLSTNNRSINIVHMHMNMHANINTEVGLNHFSKMDEFIYGPALK